MTNLNSRELVSKTHPRIEFRGQLDLLQAEILQMQCRAAAAKKLRLVQDLDELLAFSRKILAAEVKDAPLEEMELFGMDEERIHYVSHHPREFFGIGHIPPRYQFGETCMDLNYLRTRIRSVELAAMRAFSRGNTVSRKDIIQALNRMSSAVYVLYCKYLSEENVIEEQ